MAIIVIYMAIFSDLRRSALNVNTVVVSQRNIVKFHTSIDDCILHDLTKFHDPVLAKTPTILTFKVAPKLP